MPNSMADNAASVTQRAVVLRERGQRPGPDERLAAISTPLAATNETSTMARCISTVMLSTVRGHHPWINPDQEDQ